MKMFLFFLFLNPQTGDVDGFGIGGTQPNAVVCKQKAAELLANAEGVPPGEIPVTLCIDVSKVKLENPMPGTPAPKGQPDIEASTAK